MERRDCDILIAGGGLAGGLIALALARRRPDLGVTVLEAGERPGGNHRWSWFASDLSAPERGLLAPIDKIEWDVGYEVAFPGHSRLLRTPYRSMQSRDFAWALARELPAGAILTGAKVDRLASDGATLDDGRRIAARTVIDCRGLAGSAHLKGGWQVFLGRHLRLRWPHGIARPVIMDATVEQAGGYRFVYVLPLGERELFIEDTYYQDAPGLDRETLSARLDEYGRKNGWRGEIVAEETGVLPVVTGAISPPSRPSTAFPASQQPERAAASSIR